MNRYIIIKYNNDNYAKQQMQIFLDNKDLFKTKKLKIVYCKELLNNSFQ